MYYVLCRKLINFEPGRISRPRASIFTILKIGNLECLFVCLFLEKKLFDSISVNYRRIPLSIIEKYPKCKCMQLDQLIDLDKTSNVSDASDPTTTQS